MGGNPPLPQCSLPLGYLKQPPVERPYYADEEECLEGLSDLPEVILL